MSRVDFSSLPAVKRAFPTFAGGLGEPVDPAESERSEQQRQEALRVREERDRAQRLLAFLTSRGKRYEGCTLDNFETRTADQARVVEALRRYAAAMPREVAAGRGVILFGGVGGGKDHCLVGLARVGIIDHGLSVEWRNGMELFSDLRRAIHDEVPEGRIVADLARPDVLILSDPLPPSGAVTEYQAAMLFRIVESRYNGMRPMWVSLNVKSSDEADRRLGAQTVDRLRHDALALYCGWESYRHTQESRL
jgi:DNA replication protein DnaC